MALLTPPWVLQAGTYGAQFFREAVGSLMWPGGGVVNEGDLAVTPTGAMSVQVAEGQAWIPGTYAASQGPYYTQNQAAEILAIGTADPSNPRIDTVIAQVEDAAYVGSSNLAQLAVVPGTPSAGATLVNLTGAATLPANSLVLAYVLVPAGATSIVTGDIASFARQISSVPDMQIVFGTFESIQAQPGQMITAGAGFTVTLPPLEAGALVGVLAYGSPSSPVVIDGGGAEIWGPGDTAGRPSINQGVYGSFVAFQSNGVSWLMVEGARDTGWLPLPYTSGYSDKGSPFLTGAYRARNDEVWLRGCVTSNGSGGYSCATLPAGARPSAQAEFVAPYSISPYQILVQPDASGDVNLGQIPASGDYLMLDVVRFTID
jgi:hypothetical protein